VLPLSERQKQDRQAANEADRNYKKDESVRIYGLLRSLVEVDVAHSLFSRSIP
jgi:hypothetical protein